MYNDIYTLQKRGMEMGTIVSNKPDLLVKLSATALAFSLSVAKLYTYQTSILKEASRDIEYVEKLKQAYISCGVEDEFYAEKFALISFEVDKIMIECDKGDA
jgi:hypothetical protein